MKVKIRTVIAALAISMTGVSAHAQDLLARQAPIDKTIKAIDSISLRRMLPEQKMPASVNSGANFSIENPSSDIYPAWNNDHGRNYGVELPSEYKIDLRNFCMPTDSRLVTSHYGYRKQFRRFHYGTDIKVYVGDTIRSAYSGKIRIVAYEAKGYGNYVIIRHENGLETVYGHMSKHLVKENQSVRAGEPIGLGGNTGRSTGSHLHFETRFLGQYIDPEVLFNFEAQDAKADFYVYRSNGNGSLIGNPHHANPAPVLAMNYESDDSDNEEIEVKSAAPVIRDASLERSSKSVKNDKKDKKAQSSGGKVYSVKKGDSLYSIARKYHTTVDKLCKLNRISDKAILRPGQVLKCS
ncbi:MAG: peptidoglycan DD-metalloendopeptidase family protein [Bacteroidaceae bacterium]|nr:peptidoglycan DD-metalloendopeptidase family protein [Bacteroidaceae bacterium]